MSSSDSPQNNSNLPPTFVFVPEIKQVDHLPKYSVILWKDEDHSFEYITYMMQKIFQYEIARGTAIAKVVNEQGKCVVAMLPLEVAELRCEEIRSFGPDALLESSVSSMYASVEPIPEDRTLK